MLLTLIALFGFDAVPETVSEPTDVEITLELLALQAAHHAPKTKGELESYPWTTGAGHELLCTRVHYLEEICTRPVGNTFAFAADLLGPYRTKRLAGLEQIRRLKVLDHD